MITIVHLSLIGSPDGHSSFACELQYLTAIAYVNFQDRDVENFFDTPDNFFKLFIANNKNMAEK